MTEVLDIAIWLERRLHMSLGFHLPATRLYGIVVNDAEALHDENAAGARSSFIGESRDAYELIGGSSGVLARSFDAAAIVTSGWAAPLDPDGNLRERPLRHASRRRVRAVVVVADGGIASALRFEDDPETLIHEPSRGVGDMFDAMEAMWFGDPTELVNLRTTRGPCRRHA